MSSLDSFDNVIKGRLENHASELPPGMFRRINEARKPDPGKRPGIFWLSASLALLLGLISYTVVSHFDMLAPMAKNQTVAQESSESGKSTTVLGIDQDEIIASDMALENASNMEAEAANQKEANTEATSKSFLSAAVTNKADEVKGEANETSDVKAITKILDSRPNRSSSFASTSVENTISSTATQTVVSNENFSNGSSRNAVSRVSQSSAAANEELTLNDMNAEQAAGFEYDIRTWDTHTEEVVGERSFRNFKQELKKLPSIEVNSLKQPYYGSIMGANAFRAMDVGCVDFGRKKDNSNISVDFIFAPEYPVKSLTTDDSELSDFVVGRDKSESVEVAFHAGIRISNRFNNGLAIRSGLYYGQIQETFDWSEVSGTQTTITTDIDSTFNSNGDLEVTYDTTTTTIPEIRRVRAYNKYRSVDIPLILGYEISRRRLVVSFNAGILLNLSFQQRGRILSHTENQPRNIHDPSQEQLFKTRLGLGLIASSGVAYRIANRVSVLAEPTVRYILDPVNTSENPVDQKYFFTGLTTGIRYHF